MTERVRLEDFNSVPADAVRQFRQVVAVPASQVKREQVEWLERGRVPVGMVTVLAGVGGLGKSTWTCLLAARNPGVTLIATAEDSPEATVRPRLEAVKANLDHVRFVSVRAEDDLEDGIAIPEDVAQLEQLVAEMGARLIVIDPLVAHLPGHIDSHKDQSVRRALAPLYRLARTQRCAVVVLIHLNKAQGLAPLARLAGSGGFGNAARSVLLLDRDPDDPAGEDGRRRVLAHIKCNVAEEAPSLLYEVEPIVLPASAGQSEVETSRLKLIGESGHNGRSILALASEEDRSAGDDAAEFLRAELKDGARHPVADMFKAARQVGISDRTLQRARRRLGVDTGKAGFGGGWEWWLPKAPGDLAPSETPEPWHLRGTPLSMPDSGTVEGIEDAEGASLRAVAPSGYLTPSAVRTSHLRALPAPEVRRVLETYRPELVGAAHTTTPDERRSIAALLLAQERQHLVGQRAA